MTNNAETLAGVAARYRKDGYEVVQQPTAADLPASLVREYPAFVARRNGRSVLVEVWAHERLNDLPPDILPPGWSFEAVLPPRSTDYAPGPAVNPDFVLVLLTELEQYIPQAARHGRFLLAWSAVESAMRVAAGRGGLESDGVPVRELIGDLAFAGVMSDERTDALLASLAVRNRLAHGAPVDPVCEESVLLLIRTAKELLAATPSPTAA